MRDLSDYMTLTGICRISADNNGVIRVDLKDDARIGVLELEEIIKNIRSFNRIISAPIIVKLGNFNSIEKQARDMLVQRKEQTYLPACAFVATCPASKVATDLFLKMYDPNFPCGVFKSEKQATRWIKSFAVALN